ncbi:hypothetical protein GC105_14245 [Alkalibaculum sp. M08DMB]|uniref:Uncharacterized protein n=1 Tax=Alkalibaculum sporogenes TaxID=2655001 RepID=A0A6A7KD56_9FIRM|nr:DUF6544 family protein [Alkalibaculum sporogenes]MPW26943.1 hypothetical protein [Alkalibaculum sporogenes]
MVWIIIVLILLAIIMMYFAIPDGRLWKQYLTDVKSSLTDTNKQRSVQSTFTEDSVAKLPALLRQHIINGGYMEETFMDNMLIYFHNTKFRMSVGKKPIKIKFMQVNFVKRPDRHAFLTGRIAGVPLQAKDSVLDGIGSMTGVIAKQFQLFLSTGEEMNQGQLITALADAVYLPSLFLQEYMSWTDVDDDTVEGKISWMGITAKGRFTFDNNGNIVRFDTNDRYMDENGKGSSLVPWYVTYSDYKEQNGYYQPGRVSVSWMLPDGDDTYFVSDHIEVQYSINEVNL